jgi:hypothetical protein
MWKGTRYAHIMVPTTSMAKSASKSPTGGPHVERCDSGW